MGRSKSTSKPARPQAAWGIQVCLRGGYRSWYHLDERHLDDSGQPTVRWAAREAAATRFDDVRAAERVASRMDVNAEALEYLVVPLPVLPPTRRGEREPGGGHITHVPQGM